ncbi:MAG: hypothetical protein KDE63_03630 [Novosphingobium sp.]|nr:hypothetical protein [Novosphingobium sp.]
MLKTSDEARPSMRCFQVKPALDPNVRRMIYGPIRPMDEPGLLSRIFHWR